MFITVKYLKYFLNITIDKDKKNDAVEYNFCNLLLFLDFEVCRTRISQ